VPITAINFDTSLLWPLDIHLVRSPQNRSTGDLLPFLAVTLPDGTNVPYTEYRQSHSDVEVLFNPLFKPDPAVPLTDPKIKGFGIEVVKKTGNVTLVGGAAPPETKSNFILEATAKNTPGPAVAAAFVRIHVHNRVERVWFTPERLSVRARPGSSVSDVKHAFTVRAEFDDGTVADVTDSKELTFSPATRMQGPWVRIPAAATSGDILPVSVKTSAAWNSKSASGEIELLEPWESEPNVPTADLIEGTPNAWALPSVEPPEHPVWKGTLRPEAVPNVVFVGCGFSSAADHKGFEDITNLIVHKLKTDRILDPYGHLATAMNYWRLTVPAESPGISFRYEVAPKIDDGLLVALPVPSPASPGANVAQWSVEELIYAVGLPVPADLRLAIDLNTNQPVADADELRRLRFGAFDFAELYKKWNKLARPPVGGANFDAVPPGIVHSWLKFADRTFIDEVNNFPPVSIGSPPSAGEIQTNRFRFHSLRGTEDQRKAFFRKVTATPRAGLAPVGLGGPPAGSALGNLWVADPDDPNPAARRNFTFDNRRFVTIFSNVPYGQIDSGINMRHHQTFTGLSGNKSTIFGIPVARVPGRSALKVAPPTPSAATTARPHVWHTFAHELSHTLGLGDEYTQRETAFPGQESDLDIWSNLSTPATLLDGNKKVIIGQIKWNWHRIRQASVLTGPMIPKGGGIFHVLINLSSARQFAAGNKVRLRRRTPRKVIGHVVTSAVEFSVQQIPKKNLDDADDKFNTTVVLTADPAAAVGGPFEIGSLIYVPVPAPEGVRTADRPYLTLVSPAAERIMDKIGGTMSGKACVVTDAFTGNAPIEKDPQPNNKTPDTVLPLIVGVYYGGDQHACGIVHPAAACLMRTSGSSIIEETIASATTRDGIPKGISALCPVCRYALVDYVDPEKHFVNDLDYSKWFTL
jgi:hypothetical protein